MNANIQPLRRPPELRYARVAGRYVDVAANRIRRDGAEVRLTPKAMGVLRELLVRPDQVVKRDDLLGIVWRDGFPTDDVLTHAITELRRALEDDPRAPKLIETIPRVGYRLAAAVEPLESLPLLARPETRIEPMVPAQAPAAAPAHGGSGSVSDRPAIPSSRAYLRTLALIALIVAAAYAYTRIDRTAVPTDVAPVVRPAAPLATNPRAITADPSREQFPSLSPDGSSVAYVGNAAGEGESGARILLRSIDAGSSARPLTEPPIGSRDDFPVWSPDGARIAFLRWGDSGCGIHVVPALGGPSREVGECRMRTLDYIEWTPEGEGLLVTRIPRFDPGTEPPKGSIHRLDLATGELSPLPYARSSGESDIQARVSPDGTMLAFRRGAAPYSDVYVVPYAGGEPRRVTNLRARLRGYAWEADGRALVVSSDHEGVQALYRVEVATGAIAALGLEDAEFPDVARRAAVVVYQRENSLDQLAEIEVGPGEAKPRFLAPATRSDSMPAHSPDGRRIAFLSSRSGGMQLWLHDRQSDSAHPLTRYDGVELESPTWSPDGRRVLHVVRGAGYSRLAVVDVGSRRVATLSAPDENVRFGSYSRDGSTIYYSSDRGGQWQPWAMPAAGGAARRIASIEAIDPRDPLGDGFLYFSQENLGGLHRLELATGEVGLVARNVGYWNRNAWSVREDGLWLLDANEENMGSTLWRAPIEVRGANPEDWTDYERTAVMNLPNSIASYDFSLAPDAKSLVIAITTRDETDLMAADLPVPR